MSHTSSLPGGPALDAEVTDEWRVVVLTLETPDNPDDHYEIEVLRSPEWLDAAQIAVGRELHLEFDEMGVSGVGTVRW